MSMTALFDPPKDPKEVLVDARKALALPIGIASPLWLMFAGAASAGVAYWWLNRWRHVTNLEAVLAPALAAPEPEAVPVAPEVIAPTVVEAFEAAAEVVEDTVAEPVMETAPEAVIETVPEPVIAAAPEPILEVAPTPKPTPKPKAKAAAARAAPRTTSGPTRRA
jgi:outer membrane biosynthesis protein TonB